MAHDHESTTVLIVEDELMIATTLEMMLSDRGYRVIDPVSTVEDALAVLETVRPDVALLDYRLGGSTTEPLLQVLQERQIPVCMLTGYGRDALPEHYQKYPVLEKPFSLGELLAELQRICG
jgi:DNA-binding response OmpR family regulator